MKQEISYLKVTLNITTKLTLWEAIKLRIAGKNYEIIARGLLEDVRSNMKTEGTE